MVSIAHKKLVSILKELDQPPENVSDLTEWLAGKPVVEFLLSEPCKQDIIISAYTQYIYVYTQAFPAKDIIDKETGQISWPTMGTPYFNSSPDYSYSFVQNQAGELKKKHAINRTGVPVGRDSSRSLVFYRGLESEREKNWEPLQEFIMVSDIHYQSKRNSWSRINENTGDLDDHISITEDTNDSKLSMISFNWKTLEKYLAYEDLVLVRAFKFNVYNAESFIREGVVLPEIKFIKNNTSQYNIYRNDRLCHEYIGMAALQLIQPRSLDEIFAEEAQDEQRYVSFWATDWRNKEVKEISTDPKETTNYFQAEHNNLPFELSVALFRPEVLVKYKNDYKKYEIGEESGITCKGAWYLRCHGINPDGAVFVYICDLRTLPYDEQLYWRSYNIKPEETDLKKVISDNAFKSDFMAEWRESSPRSKLLNYLQEWEEDKNIAFWKLKDKSLLDKAHVPTSGSREEWAEALLQLDQLVVEGFSLKNIQELLIKQGKEIDEKEKSLACLNRLVFGEPTKSGKGSKLEALRELHDLRSKIKGHVNGESARKISEDILEKFGSYAKHYEDLCERIEGDLLRIDVSLP